MEIKELIDTLRICADGDTICPACPRYEKYKYGGTAECNEKLVLEAADTIESQLKRIAELEATRNIAGYFEEHLKDLISAGRVVVLRNDSAL